MKTAVEHIEETMLYKQLDYQEFSTLIREAKEMEKKQIIEAANWGALYDTGDIYYKEKYITDKQKSEGKNI